MKLAAVFQTLFFLFALGAPAAAATGWQFEKEQRNGAAVRTAWVQNAEGFRFSLVRKNEGRVTAVFRIPEDSGTLLGTAPPVMRVDGRADIPVDSWGVYVDMSARQVGWFIWDGTGDPCDPEPPAQDRKRALCEIMRGRQLVFEYYAVTGDSFETRFSLNGSIMAIQRLLRE
jgi:hypothetical protein